jgi:hypothetical protein
MQPLQPAPIQIPRRSGSAAFPDRERAMDPTQTRLFLMMTLVSLLFAAQLATQSGAFAALP